MSSPTKPTSTVPVSRGFYRIPYEDGTVVRVTRDASDHEPHGRVDLVGLNGKRIVAAAAGYVRFVRDFYTGFESGYCRNNYVWIEHRNGEWTKYAHVATGSVTKRVGDPVSMGEFIAIESDIGCATGSHLHFEVGVPHPDNPVLLAGGHLRDNDNSKRNRVPRICGIVGGRFKSGMEYIAKYQHANYVEDRTEIVVYGRGIEEYQCFFRQIHDAGYAPTWLNFFNSGGHAYFNAIARPSSPRRRHYGFHGMSSDAYDTINKHYQAACFEPVCVDSFTYRGTVRYSGYFAKTSEPSSFTGYHGMSERDHRMKFDSFVRVGWVPVILSVVSLRGTREWTAIYKKIDIGSFFVRSMIPVSDMLSVCEEQLTKGRKLRYANGYNHNGKAFIVAVFSSKTPSQSDYYHQHGLTRRQLETVSIGETGEKGSLTEMVVGYEDGGADIRYSAAWS